MCITSAGLPSPHTLQHGEGNQQVGEDCKKEEHNVRCAAPANVDNLQHGMRLGGLVLDFQGHNCISEQTSATGDRHMCTSENMPITSAQKDMPLTCEEDDDHRIVHRIPAHTSRGVSGNSMLQRATTAAETCSTYYINTQPEAHQYDPVMP